MRDIVHVCDGCGKRESRELETWDKDGAHELLEYEGPEDWIAADIRSIIHDLKDYDVSETWIICSKACLKKLVDKM